jgi:hypothetical protein
MLRVPATFAATIGTFQSIISLAFCGKQYVPNAPLRLQMTPTSSTLKNKGI